MRALVPRGTVLIAREEGKRAALFGSHHWPRVHDAPQSMDYEHAFAKAKGLDRWEGLLKEMLGKMAHAIFTVDWGIVTECLCIQAYG